MTFMKTKAEDRPVQCADLNGINLSSSDLYSHMKKRGNPGLPIVFSLFLLSFAFSLSLKQASLFSISGSDGYLPHSSYQGKRNVLLRPALHETDTVADSQLDDDDENSFGSANKMSSIEEIQGKHCYDDPNCDPCAPSSSERYLMGQGGKFGVMYVVAGTENYAQTFLPVVDHFRNKLNISDASERNKEQQRQQQQQQEEGGGDFNPMKWALVTEPHLCRGILRDVTSFFDIVVTISVENSGDNATLMLPSVFNEMLQKPEFSKLRDQTKKKVPKHGVFGNFEHSYGQGSGVLFWSKVLKVTSLAKVSPFELTIFNDMDNIPCYDDFGHRLLNAHNLSVAAAGTNELDIAATPLRNDAGATPNELDHWFTRGSFEEFLEDYSRTKMGRRSPTNRHSSRTVILNITSARTLEFLKRYYYMIAYSFLEPHDLPKMDQPYFGKAALSMYLDEPSWKDVDLSEKYVCEPKNSCGGPKSKCIFVHKLKY